jgi:hypothetical protein
MALRSGLLPDCCPAMKDLYFVAERQNIVNNANCPSPDRDSIPGQTQSRSRLFAKKSNPKKL